MVRSPTDLDHRHTPDPWSPSLPRTPSNMIPLGIPAPDFRLPDPAGDLHGLADAETAQAVLVVFMCNHCPFVVHIADQLAASSATAGWAHPFSTVPPVGWDSRVPPTHSKYGKSLSNIANSAEP